MKALYLWDSEYPWDIRVDKTCSTLVSRGWEVHLVCRNRKRQPTEELYRGVFIHRISYLPESAGRLNDIYTFPLFISPVWIAKLAHVVREQAVDVIIARDLPMALAAVIVGKWFGVPTILDMAECYPELIRLKWQFEPFQLRNVIIRNPVLADFVERIVISSVDHIFVMVEESRDRLLAMRCRDSKISIVSNTPPKGKFALAPASFPGSLAQNRGKLILLYVGLLNYSRGLDTVIRALGEYVKQHQDVFLVILGAGNAKDELVDLSRHLRLDDYIGFEGWVDNELVPEYVASADVCLVPHHRCSHWESTIPNKLFDYMAAGKSVLASDVTPVKRIVDETTCGRTYRDYDVHDLVDSLRRMRDVVVRAEFGLNGQRSVNDRYNWEVDADRMLNAIHEVAKVL